MFGFLCVVVARSSSVHISCGQWHFTGVTPSAPDVEAFKQSHLASKTEHWWEFRRWRAKLPGGGKAKEQERQAWYDGFLVVVQIQHKLKTTRNESL